MPYNFERRNFDLEDKIRIVVEGLNPYGLIGTLLRDCLDHVLIFGAWHLQRILTAYTHHHNQYIDIHISFWGLRPRVKPAYLRGLCPVARNRQDGSRVTLPR